MLGGYERLRGRDEIKKQTTHSKDENPELMAHLGRLRWKLAATTPIARLEGLSLHSFPYTSTSRMVIV